MKRRLKVRLALILAFTMLLGSGIAAFGGKSEVEVIPSGSGIVPTVYNDPQAPEIQGYSSERHESSKIGDHSLLGGKIIVSVFEGVYKNSLAVNWVSTIPISYVFLGGSGVGTMFCYEEDPATMDTALYPHLTEPDKPHPFNQITFYYHEEPKPTYSSVTVTKLNDDDETPLAGWVFTLFTKAANGEDTWEQVDETKTTGENGQVFWEGLEPGNYKVEETSKDGWVAVSPEGGKVEFALAESKNETLVFRNKLEADQPDPVYSSVSVLKLNNADQAPLAGWVFTLFTKVANGENTWKQVGEPRTTGENGKASWDNLEAGDYRVEEAMKDGWVVFSPQGGFYEFTLEPEEHEVFTFINEREPEAILGSISGMKFHDKNSNGQLDEGEDGLPGWKIELYADSDAVEPTLMQVSDKRLVGYEITGEEGTFEFIGLPLGRYYLREAMTPEQAEEYQQTTPEENWFTVDLTETSSVFSGVLFGNVRKEATPEPVTYTLTVKYVIDGTDETLADPTYYTKNEGESATATAKSFSEYLLKDGQSDSVTYVLDSDKEHVFVYVEKTPSDPPGEDPPGEDPPGEDPPAEEPPVEEPPVEEPPVEEPPVVEPPVEEPTAEEPPVEEPEIEIIDDEEVPLTALPTTGGVAPEILYGIGMLLTATGVVIKRRRKF